jgi:hypothetical protein
MTSNKSPATFTRGEVITLIADAIVDERKRIDQRVDHLDRKIRLLEVQERGRRQREERAK